jgi:hypothetical protein
MQRRTFVKSSLIGIGAIPAAAMFANLLADETASGATSEMVSITGSGLRLDYDLKTGRMNLRPPRGAPLVLGATAAVGLPREVVLAADEHYVRQGRIEDSTEPGIAGKRLVITCKDATRRLDLEIRITLLSDRQGAVVEFTVTNVSEREIEIPFAEPIRALLNERAGCGFGRSFQVPQGERILTNGYMYYDPGQLLNSDSFAHQDLTSWWNVAVHVPQTRDTLVAGYLDNSDGEGQIIVGWDIGRGTPPKQAAFNLTARSLYNPRFLLKPGKSIRSGRVMLLRSNRPFAALQDYAETSGRLHGVKLNPIINGWCNWFITYSNPTEEIILQNAEFIAKHLKPYGLEWVQLDDGYERAFGDWVGNKRFPHGMKWLAQQIRKMGLKPGIWLAPYLISKGTEVAEKHPDWLIKNTDGSTFEIKQRADYGLDITHPEARKWFFNLFKTVAEDWGYDFIKTDFVERSILAAPKYHDPTLSRAQVYRLGAQTMREAIGPRRHLLDCGPAWEALGLVDSMRIELDIGTHWAQYVKNITSSAPAMAHRYYLNGRLWINDVDHLGMKQLTIPQARTAASIIALSGGTTISGDDLPKLDVERVEILKKVLPAYGESARPVDLFDNPYPEIFSLPVKNDREHWQLLGYFNYDETATKERTVELVQLELDPRKTYLAYEFWTQKFLGEIRTRLPLHFESATVNVVALREKTGVPQILGTDRHITQGGVELQQVGWTAETLTLAGKALGAAGMKWRMMIYVPEGYALDQNPGGRKGCSVVSNKDRLLCVLFDFADRDRIEWTLKFHK